MSQQIQKTILQVTILHPKGEGPEDNGLWTLEQIGHEIDSGNWIGQWGTASTEPVPPEKLKEELLALGNDGTFFGGDEPDTLLDGRPRPQTVDVLIGGRYEFYAEMQEVEQPAAERMRNYTGQMVTVIAGPFVDEDPEGCTLYRVRTADGREFDAQVEEINGWDKALGQYFWPDGTFGPNKDTRYLSNEGRAPADARG